MRRALASLLLCSTLLCTCAAAVAMQEQPTDSGRRGGGGRRGGDQPAAAKPAEGDKPAGDNKDAAAKDGKDKGAEKDKGKDAAPVVTEHQVTINGKVIKYRATAGMLPAFDDKAKTKANIFYVAYEKISDAAPESNADAEKTSAAADKGDGAKAAPKPAALSAADAAARPITFAFNGGPGSSSVWLHLGALGPRRVLMGADGEMPALPTRLTDNEFSWLDVTDLVFIDPVSTGYSRAVDGEDPHQFHGLDEDIRAVGDFIRLYLTRSQRWLSPKFLAGESYGTTRASGLAGDLHNRLGIDLNGIVLISAVLNFETLSFDAGNDTPYPLFLPTYTATAFFHHKLQGDLARDLKSALAASQQWAETEYLQALAQGDRLAPAKREEIAQRLAALTGLSVDFVKRANLRVTIFNFVKELLRDQNRSVGRYDSRYKGIDRNGVSSSPDYDPSYSVVQGPFTAALNAYIRGELKYESDLNYEILTDHVRPWRFDSATNRYANVTGSLRDAMTQNPGLHVMVASGYYDLATPFSAMSATIATMGLDPSISPHIYQTYYEAGHMMYLRQADLSKLKSDVAAFYAATLTP